MFLETLGYPAVSLPLARHMESFRHHYHQYQSARQKAITIQTKVLNRSAKLRKAVVMGVN